MSSILDKKFSRRSFLQFMGAVTLIGAATVAKPAAEVVNNIQNTGLSNINPSNTFSSVVDTPAVAFVTGQSEVFGLGDYSNGESYK